MDKNDEFVDAKQDIECILKEKLVSSTATLAEGLQYYSIVTGRGDSFPLDLEEKILSLAIKEEPDRSDLRLRLARVFRMQQKECPAWLAAPSEEEIERAIDHQEAASNFNENSGFKDMEDDFFALYNKYRRYSMASIERFYALHKAISYIELSGVKGDVVECGVWLGGSMMFAAGVLLSLGSVKRKLHLYDTFEGLPRPDETKDIDLWGNNALDGWEPMRINDTCSHWARATLEEVRDNMTSTGYPGGSVTFVQGKVEDTLLTHVPEALALLRLDTDWYSSTKCELEVLYPRLSVGGVLIIDDYGHFKGARAAVDEYMSSLRHPMLLMRVDYSCRVGVKIGQD